jgi:hypothetical protein
MNARIAASLLTVFLVGASAARLAAQDYQGAAAALRELTSREAAQARAEATPAGALRKDVEAFPAKAAALPALEAAGGWIALMERYLALDPAAQFQPGDEDGPLQFTNVLAALPPPAAWDALSAALVARSARKPKTADEVSLLLLAHVLKPDLAAQTKDLAALEALLAKARPDEKAMLAHPVLELSDALAKRSGDPARVVRSIELRLKMGDAAAHGAGGGLELPDLVTLVGAPQATGLLRRLLVMPGAEINIGSGEATRRLARRLALEMVAKLRTPQWRLAQATDATALALYEALEKRFAAPRAGAVPDNGDQYQYSRQTAQGYYLIGLILAGRTKEAATFVRRLPAAGHGGSIAYHALEALDRAGQAGALSGFLRTVLAADPRLPLWDLYIPAATRAGQSAQVVALLRQVLAKPGLPAAAQ